ncbi:MAG: hypothetical protein N3E51_05095, partial [Candidatus Micrarchaeota archaeon]|nr:hypothetical protein [Candidatus Micrarchaeota archaeon]
TAEEITPSCNGAGETLLNCDGTLQSGYTCTISGTAMTITGLRHSAVIQYGASPTPPSPAPSPSPPTSGGAAPFFTQPPIPKTEQEAWQPPAEPEEPQKPDDIISPSKPPAEEIKKTVDKVVSELPIGQGAKDAVVESSPLWLVLMALCPPILLLLGAIAAYLLFFRKKRRGLEGV